MGFVVQTVIALLFLNKNLVVGEEILATISLVGEVTEENEKIESSATTETSFEKLEVTTEQTTQISLNFGTEMVLQNLHLANDNLTKIYLKEDTEPTKDVDMFKNFFNNSKTLKVEGSPKLHQNLSIFESKLVAIVLKDRAGKQADVKYFPGTTNECCIEEHSSAFGKHETPIKPTTTNLFQNSPSGKNKKFAYFRDEQKEKVNNLNNVKEAIVEEDTLNNKGNKILSESLEGLGISEKSHLVLNELLNLPNPQSEGVSSEDSISKIFLEKNVPTFTKSALIEKSFSRLGLEEYSQPVEKSLKSQDLLSSAGKHVAKSNNFPQVISADNKYRISTLPLISLAVPHNSNVSRGDVIVYGDSNKNQEDRRDGSNNSNQSWIDNRAKITNEYNTATKPLNTFELSKNSGLAESEIIEIVLKESAKLSKTQEERDLDLEVTLPEVDNNSSKVNLFGSKTFHVLRGSLISKLIKTELIRKLLNAADDSNQKQEEKEALPEVSTVSTSSLFKSSERCQNSKATAADEVEGVLNEVKNLSIKHEELHLSYPESVAEVTATPIILIEQTSKTVKNFESVQEHSTVGNELSMEVFNDFLNLHNKQEENALNSIKSISDSATTSLSPQPLSTFRGSKIYNNLPDKVPEISAESGISESPIKPSVSLEEYAVKQMNFILDYLLLETQEFVATVLQATVNSVFPRDHLKRYAEGVNRVLNRAVASDYSEEITKDTESFSQDEIYEEIVEKLNFLKNKPSKYLQRQMPPEWLNDFREKRTELGIWLDKATEQMHKEFNNYITEEEDPIKHQYFNETFDDISRATEIHHKLALLADLVKIIKNKKQITFMDLYMQT